MIDSSVNQISLDVQAFKNIRNRLFTQITDEISKEQERQGKHQHSMSISSQTKTINNNKLYLYLFHLFESVIANVSQLIAKTMQTSLSDLGNLESVEGKEADLAKKGNEKETINTINTIATGSEAVSDDKNGFFSENLKSILKSKTSIEKAIERISGQLLVYNQSGKKQVAMQERVKAFIA